MASETFCLHGILKTDRENGPILARGVEFSHGRRKSISESGRDDGHGKQGVCMVIQAVNVV